MPVPRTNLKTAQYPLDLLIEAARRLIRHGEHTLAEELLRSVLAQDTDNPAARRWLEYALEAQGKYNEAYKIHIQNKSVFKN